MNILFRMIVSALALGLVGMVSVQSAFAQTERATLQTPEKDRPGRATGPAQVQLGPIKLPKKPYDARIPYTPDIDQHSTWQSFLFHPAMDDGARERNRPPAQYNYNTRVFLNYDFCGPAAIANQLVWLDRTAYPQITDEPNNYAAAMMMANELGRKNYMNTVSGVWDEYSTPIGGGTTAHDMVNGTLRYLAERNVKVKTVRVTSAFDYGLDGKVEMNDVPLQVDIAKPEEADIHSAVRRRSIVVTIHGHYKPGLPDDYAVEKNAYAAPPLDWKSSRLTRFGGHWAAPVGYGVGTYGTYQADKTLYHDSAGPNRKVESQTVRDWDMVSADNFDNNPLLIRYVKGSKLPREALRCSFAPKPLKDADDKNWSLECRGNLYGHHTSYKPVSSDQAAEYRGGMPNINSKVGAFKGATAVGVLEGLFEFEIMDPPKSGPKRLNQ